MAAATSGELRRAAVPGGRLAALLSSLREEFALRPHRLRSAFRAAAIGALGAGLMAAAHIDSPLGPYLIWALAGAPVAMFRWRTAVILTVIMAATITLAVIAARALAQSPPLMLTVVALFGAFSTYAIGRYSLGSVGLVIQVLVFDTLYNVIFAPNQIGWGSAATFDGVAVGLGLIALFDNWFWPDPAEAILVELLADNLNRVRASLIRAADDYLAGNISQPEPLVPHEMSASLTLLARAQAEGFSQHRRGVLVAAMTRLSRLRSIANEMIVANDPQVPHGIALLLAPEIRRVINAIDETLDELLASPAAMLRSGYYQLPTAEPMRSAMEALDARLLELQPSLTHIEREERANFSFFLSCLNRGIRLIERPLDESVDAGEHAAPSAAPFDPAGARYCIKVAVALAVGYVIGLTSQRADLSTIMTTIIITVLPTYGAAARKMVLRLVGAIIGGGIVVLTVIIVSPNFETVPVYVLALFVVLAISSYASQTSGRISYAGKQFGTTFLLAFAGLTPTTGVEPPLWRVWAILVGTGVAIVVSLILWPEYAGDSLLPRLRRLLQLTLDLAPSATADAVTIRGIETQLNGVLEQTLAVADDARLEGHAGKLNADAIVQIAGTLRRIAHRLQLITFAQLELLRPELDPATEIAARTSLGAIIAHLQLWRAWIERPTGIASVRPDVQTTQSAITVTIANLGARIEADGFARLSRWTLAQRRTLFAELESLRRLSVLMGELDDGLRRLPGSLESRGEN